MLQFSNLYCFKRVLIYDTTKNSLITQYSHNAAVLHGQFYDKSHCATVSLDHTVKM